jgi:hypothetical protein
MRKHDTINLFGQYLLGKAARVLGSTQFFLLERSVGKSEEQCCDHNYLKWNCGEHATVRSSEEYLFGYSGATCSIMHLV